MRCQSFDTLTIFREYELKPKVIMIPATLITYGYSSFIFSKVKDWDSSINYTLRSSKYYTIDDYIIYAPFAIDLGLTLAGYKSKHSYPNKIGIYCMSTAINAIMVYPVKSWTNRERPNKTDFHSFPSGHTSNSFVGAEFFWQEYNHRSKLLASSGYLVASTTGYFRLQNNEHWFSDVVAGAGIGILSTKLTYWLYPKIYKLIFPSYAKKHHYVAF